MPPERVPPRHRVFLLRIWEERGDLSPHVTYRLSLEDTHTRARHGFENPERLLAYLLWVIAEMHEGAVGNESSGGAGEKHNPGESP